MASRDSAVKVSGLRLVLIPGIITLAVTVLRLVGELLHWSKLLFDLHLAVAALWSGSLGWCRSSVSTLL